MKNSVSERSFLIESDEEDDAAAVEDGKRRGRHGGGDESGDDDDDGSDSSSPCDSPRVVAARCSQPSSYTQQWPQSYRYVTARPLHRRLYLFRDSAPVAAAGTAHVGSKQDAAAASAKLFLYSFLE